MELALRHIAWHWVFRAFGDLKQAPLFNETRIQFLFFVFQARLEIGRITSRWRWMNNLTKRWLKDWKTCLLQMDSDSHCDIVSCNRTKFDLCYIKAEDIGKNFDVEWRIWLKDWRTYLLLMDLNSHCNIVPCNRTKTWPLLYQSWGHWKKNFGIEGRIESKDWRLHFADGFRFTL